MLGSHTFRVLAAMLLAIITIPATNLAAQQADALDELLNTRISAASRYAQRVSDAAASITIITAEDIERRGGRTLGEILSWVPGFHTTNDRNYMYLGVRGFSRPTDYNNRVLLLLNGHPINEGVYGSVGMSFDAGIVLSALERIEVVRGPGSALYGTNAVLAVVNLVTRTSQTREGVDVWAEAGSGETWIGSGLAAFQVGGAEVLVGADGGDSRGRDLYFADFDDPATNNGVAVGMDWERWGNLLLVVQRGGWRVQARASERTKGFPTGAWFTTFNDPRSHTLDRFMTLEVRRVAQLTPAHTVTLSAALDGYKYEGDYPTDDFYSADETTWHRGLVTGQWMWDRTPGHRVLVGADFAEHFRADYWYWTVDDDGVVDRSGGDYPTHHGALFAQNESELSESVTVTVGARLDAVAGERAAFTPRAAVVFAATDRLTLKALYGEAFRAPSASERYFDEGGALPNPELRPERIRTAELVAEQRLAAGVFGTATLYHYAMTNLINQVSVGEEEYIYENVERARVEGVEVAVRAGVGPLDAYSSYSFQHTHADTTNEELTNAPPHLVRAGATASLGRRLRVGADLLYDSPRLTLHDTRTQAALLANTRVSAQLGAGLSIALQIRNLLDREFDVPAGNEHIQSSIVQDGRTVALRLAYRF